MDNCSQPARNGKEAYKDHCFLVSGIGIGGAADGPTGTKEDAATDHKVSVRPAISYAGLITEAIQNSPEQQLILSQIYDYIQEHYPYFKAAGPGWKNSIRHNLSLNRSFAKTPRLDKAPGKGSYWRLADDHAADHRRYAPGERLPAAAAATLSAFNPSHHNPHPVPIYPGRYGASALGMGDGGFNSRLGPDEVAHLQPIRPRPNIDSIVRYPPTGSQLDHTMNYDPGATFFPAMMDLAGGGALVARQPVHMANYPANLPQPMLEPSSSSSSFDTITSAASPLGFASNFNYRLASTDLFNDVWLGAGTPKQNEPFDAVMSFVDSTSDLLQAIPSPIGNTPTTPPSAFYNNGELAIPKNYF